MREKGFEPSRLLRQQDLNLPRLPLRHSREEHSLEDGGSRPIAPRTPIGSRPVTQEAQWPDNA